MFSNKKAGAEAAAETTIIAKGVSLRGDVSFCGNFYLEGSIEGALRAVEDSQHAVFTLSNQGRVIGEVRVPQVVIDGTVEGDIYCSERLELAANAMIHGDVHYKVLEMAAGARVTGRMIHEDEPVARQLTGPSAVNETQAAASDDDDMMAANARA